MRDSRPLTAADLVAEDRGADANAANSRPDEAITRAAQSCTRLKAVLNALNLALAPVVAAPADVPFDLTGLRDALRDLALTCGVTAYPLSSLGSAVELRAPLVTGPECVARVARSSDARSDRAGRGWWAEPRRGRRISHRRRDRGDWHRSRCRDPLSFRARSATGWCRGPEHHRGRACECDHPFRGGSRGRDRPLRARNGTGTCATRCVAAARADGWALGTRTRRGT